MRPGDLELASTIRGKLVAFKRVRRLPGINSRSNENCLVEQIVDSIRRIKYVELIREKEISPLCTDTAHFAFDPIKAASWHKRAGNLDEAFWLVFLSVHFGKNAKTKWNLARGVYSGLENNDSWTWQNISNNIGGFRQWLDENQNELKELGKFGNHRKYESLNAFEATGTGNAIATYIDWIGPEHTHVSLLEDLPLPSRGDERETFRYLYNNMNLVARFGRTGRFDYLTMIGKMGLFDIEPDSTYMHGATGPVLGARLLFGGSINAGLSQNELDNWLDNLEGQLELHFGMQVLEDALCNWQKSPAEYKYFGG